MSTGHWYYCPECLCIFTAPGRCHSGAHKGAEGRVTPVAWPRLKKLFPCTSAEATYQVGGLNALRAMAAEREDKPAPPDERYDRLIVDDPYVAQPVGDDRVDSAKYAWEHVWGKRRDG